jgi:hypothetical protein
VFVVGVESLYPGAHCPSAVHAAALIVAL